MASQDYKLADNEYRVTSLLKGTRELVLERRYHEEIEQDVADMIWLLLGTAAHKVLESFQEESYQIKEERLKVEVGDKVLSGQFDLYDANLKQVIDYKTTSVWKIIYGDFEDWRRQLLIYAYMLKQTGFEVEGGEIIAILKDHNKREAKTKDNYPPLPVKKVSFSFSEKDFAECGQWIEKRLEEIGICLKLPDNDLPICTEKERYNSGDRFAVMKHGQKKAVKLFDNEFDAHQHLTNLLEVGKNCYIETRKGEDKKCKDYCSVCEFCNYYKEVVE